MELLIDHTSLHAVGRCLQKEAMGEPDLAGLLQFATQIVFCNTISLSNVDSGGVINTSRDIASVLKPQGIDESIFSFINLTKDTFFRASINAAEKLAEDLNYVLPNTQLDPEKLLPTAKPNMDANLLQHVERVHNAISSGSIELRNDLLKESQNKEYLGSAAYMLAKSDSLWNVVRDIAIKSDWKKNDTDHLGVYLRYYLNNELAKLATTVNGDSYEYSPAVPRARIIDKYSIYVINKLSEVVGNAAKNLEPVLLGAPSVAGALVLRSKGSVKGLISEALRAREKATELRKALYCKLKCDTGHTECEDADIHKLRKTISTLSKALQQDLRIIEQPKLRDAFEVQFVGLIPIPNFNKLIDWFIFKKNQKNITILSEFAKSLVNYKDSDPYACKKLEDAVYKKHP